MMKPSSEYSTKKESYREDNGLNLIFRGMLWICIAISALDDRRYGCFPVNYYSSYTGGNYYPGLRIDVENNSTKRYFNQKQREKSSHLYFVGSSSFAVNRLLELYPVLLEEEQSPDSYMWVPKPFIWRKEETYFQYKRPLRLS